MDWATAKKVWKIWESHSTCCNDCVYYRHQYATMWEPADEVCRVLDEARGFDRCPGLVDDAEVAGAGEDAVSDADGAVNNNDKEATNGPE